MTSPCGKIRIPINEKADDKPARSQEYLDLYHGEGIQHIALGTDDIYATVDALKRARRRAAQTRIDTYYELVDKRIPGHGENVDELKQRSILIDGAAGRRAAAADLHARTGSGRSSSRSSSARATRVSAKATSRRCSRSIELDQMRRGVLERQVPRA